MSKGKIFMSLPTWSKGVITVAMTAGVVWAGYELWQYFKKQSELKSANEETNASADEAKKLLLKGIKPTLNGTMLISTVNGIKQAYLSYDAITRPHFQSFLHEIVKVKNDLDMLNLIKVYSIQTINFPFTKFTVSNFEGNLTQSVKNFLNNTEITAVNNLLAGKGIKYRF